jgi:hypothetical protein
MGNGRGFIMQHDIIMLRAQGPNSWTKAEEQLIENSHQQDKNNGRMIQKQVYDGSKDTVSPPHKPATAPNREVTNG